MAETSHLEIVEPAILVRINQLYDSAMDERELYDYTRGVWKVGERREGARFALSVFLGKVLEVYEIDAWHPAGTTEYATRAIDLEAYSNRWEFTGHKAGDGVRGKYVEKSVAHYFVRGEANPIKYVNC